MTNKTNTNYRKMESIKFPYDKRDPLSIEEYAKKAIGHCLRELVDIGISDKVSEKAAAYGTNRKGYFGDLVQEHYFGIKPNSRPEPDFAEAKVELKTTPLKKNGKDELVAKERLVFSMIDYKKVVGEKWETSSFLAKNGMLLLMFYLYEKQLDLMEYRFLIVRLLKMIDDFPSEDMIQIKKDWEFIVGKIRAGEADKLSEADTYYLGACTKSSDSSKRRDQPYSDIKAKPRAFSLKQSYINFIIRQTKGHAESVETLYKKDGPRDIESYVNAVFRDFIGKYDVAIQQSVGLTFERRPKHYRRMLVDKILGISHNTTPAELEKANVTLRVIALEPDGRLVESISFPHIDYCEIVGQKWEESEFYEQLYSMRFLFVVFRKETDDKARLEKVVFWKFPVEDLDKVRSVWETAVKNISNDRFDLLPKMSEHDIAHVRPHGRNAADRSQTPHGKMETKRCFWLNARYIADRISH